VQIGAGGIGGMTGYSLAKAGIGTAHVVDPDVVEPSNLNRQFFLPRDLYEPKAWALAKRLAQAGALGSTFWGHPLFFSEFRERFPGLVPDLVLSGVDNNRCRLESTQWCLEIERPQVCVGLSRQANGGYCFVQEPGGACLGCFLGSRLTDGARSPCPGTPAVLDVLQVLCGYAAFAVSTLLTARPRRWNLVRVFLERGETQAAVVQRRPDCPVCGSRARLPAVATGETQ